MPTLFRLDPARRDQIVQMLADMLGADPRVCFAYVHGSFLQSDRFHDIDVGVYFDGSSGGLDGPAAELAARLSARTGYPVDVRALNDAPLSFVFHVLQGRLLVTRDEALLAEVIERTVRDYLDIEPLLRRATREMFAS